MMYANAPNPEIFWKVGPPKILEISIISNPGNLLNSL